ncbi:hypothetical protein PGT21_007455 [Puccinia graminis f. sp. tritici]|uniref:Uncharacterized protein n=1 Tax=Puccinia graminis f. sp. tritici TaxID=56615 RepID=A0A5B0LLA7_PUCGR|nr:hypothetical protein PGTUg99_003226 [Puccinia graminis f. sp. tritici]KAA1065677.1 hypothetical protein PGT21_007455 [Puccinia graminis f. sp. tritici]
MQVCATLVLCVILFQAVISSPKPINTHAKLSGDDDGQCGDCGDGRPGCCWPGDRGHH